METEKERQLVKGTLSSKLPQYTVELNPTRKLWEAMWVYLCYPVSGVRELEYLAINSHLWLIEGCPYSGLVCFHSLKKKSSWTKNGLFAIRNWAEGYRQGMHSTC